MLEPAGRQLDAAGGAPAPPTKAELADPAYIPILPPHTMGWYAAALAIVGLVSLGLLFVALWLFGRLEDNFAEEI